MLGQKTLPQRQVHASRLSLRRQRRSVLACVLVDGRVVDEFSVSSPQTLRAALRPIYAHLPSHGEVRLVGVEESSLPLGIARTRSETSLGDLPGALAFLAA